MEIMEEGDEGNASAREDDFYRQRAFPPVHPGERQAKMRSTNLRQRELAMKASPKLAGQFCRGLKLPVMRAGLLLVLNR